MGENDEVVVLLKFVQSCDCAIYWEITNKNFRSRWFYLVVPAKNLLRLSWSAASDPVPRLVLIHVKAFTKAIHHMFSFKLHLPLPNCVAQTELILVKYQPLQHIFAKQKNVEKCAYICRNSKKDGGNINRHPKCCIVTKNLRWSFRTLVPRLAITLDTSHSVCFHDCMDSSFSLNVTLVGKSTVEMIVQFQHSVFRDY